MDSECATWNSGAALKAFVSSARRPEKLELFRKTSRCTSRAMPSTVPGLASPNASLRSLNAAYTSSTRAKGPVWGVCGCVMMPAMACSFVGLSSMVAADKQYNRALAVFDGSWYAAQVIAKGG
jgi:hypothetical protein